MSGDNRELDSVWLKFTEKNMEIMREAGRANHPSRNFVFAAIEGKFTDRHFKWLDIGTVGMFDYEYMFGIGSDFTHTRVDISPSIIEDSKSYLRNERDRIIGWDIQQSLDESAPFESTEKFDLLTMRHIVNHLSDYQAVFDNAKRLLAIDSLLIITLHIPLTESPSVVLNYDGYPTDERGTVVRHHINRAEIFDVATCTFEFINFTRFRDPDKPTTLSYFGTSRLRLAPFHKHRSFRCVALPGESLAPLRRDSSGKQPVEFSSP